MNELYKKEDADTEEKESTAKDNNSACITRHSTTTLYIVFIRRA